MISFPSFPPYIERVQIVGTRKPQEGECVNPFVPVVPTLLKNIMVRDRWASARPRPHSRLLTPFPFTKPWERRERAYLSTRSNAIISFPPYGHGLDRGCLVPTGWSA